MDYDDNEFQDQNCHVGGEGSSKLSPVLNPYALSKFDFDDGLQGHLRFDSLVENEVFLGIQSQEDKQWIEDFSRGSGVFGSSASEPCPILRSNNVWSEAASSESVEMLLKSVGQEETVTIVKEPNACQKLNRVAEQMESHFKEEEDKINITDTDLRYFPEQVTDHVSGLINVEGVPNCPGVETTAHEKSQILRPKALGELCVVYGDGDDIDRKDGEKEAVTSLDKFFLNEKHDPSGSNMHREDKDSQSQDVIVNTVGVANQETVTRVTDVGFDSASCLSTDGVNEVKEDNVVSKEVYVDDQFLKEAEKLKNLPSSSSNSGNIAFHPDKSNVSKLDEPSSFAVIRSVELHIAEECDEDVHPAELNKGSECDHIDSSDMTQIHQQFDEDIQDDLPKDFQGDGNFVADVFEVNTEKAEISSGLKLKTCPTIEVTDILEKGKTLMQGSDCQLGTEVLIRDNQASLLSNLNKRNSNVQGDGTSIIFEVENTNGTSTCFSAPFQEGEHSTIKSKNGDNTSSVHKGSNLEDRVTSATVSGLASDLNSIDHGQVVFSNGEDKPMFPNDSNEVECDVSEPFNHDKGVGLSFSGGSSIDSAETSPLLCERGPHVDLVADEIGEISVSGNVGPVGTNLTPLKDISQKTDMMDPVLEIEKVSASNSTKELSGEAAGYSSLVDVTLDTASESEQMVEIMNVTAGQLSPVAEISDSGIQSVQAEKDFQNSESSSDKLELFPNIYGSTSKQNSDADGSNTPAKHEAVGKDHTLSPSEVSDSCLPTPTLSRYNVLKASNGEKKEMVEKSLVKSVPTGGSLESACKEARQNDIGKDDKSFSFEVHLSSGVVGEYGQNNQLFPTTQSSKSNKDASPSSPSVGNMEPKILLEPPRLSSQAPDLEIAHGGSTGTPARKRGRASGKAPGKQSAKKSNSLKETTPSRQSERGDSKSSVSMSLSGIGQLQFIGVKLHEKLEQSSLVSCSGVLGASSSLPDLNTSASPSVLFLQPFSDRQQMQLRAQIFVYGSLIQGAAPDETCMVAAFGTSDGGRSMREPVWRDFVEKLHDAKSNLRKPENPLQLQSGSNPPEQSSTKTNSLKSTVLPSPAGRASSKGTPSPVINSMIPLSSPLWNVSTPFHGLQSFGMPRSSVFDYHQALSPSYPFQTPPSRNVTVNNSSWQSHASFPSPWINVSQSSPFDGSARLPITENVKFAPMKESVLPVASGTKYSFPSSTIDHSSPSVSAEPSPLPDVKRSALSFVDSGAKHSFLSSTVLSSGPSMSAEPYPVADVRKKTLPSGQKTAEPKSRKRKKSTASENLAQIPLLAQARTEPIPTLVSLFTQARKELVPAPVSTPIVPSHFSTSVVVSTPFFGLKENDARIIATASPSYSSDQPKEIERCTEQKTNLLEDTSIKTEAAKQLAEDAAALATAAVSHSQTIWDQMDKRKKFKLAPEVEDKIASAAVVVATAAAVAKAAAAAAQVAFNAASQAKMMADEAWISSRVDSPAFSRASSISNKSPSIPKVGAEGNFASSILVSAKEAAKKRVEIASFASKRAESLDAIVKAAELAAAAVSQAGRIVALGDPPSLAKLVEAGPEGYWRVSQVPLKQSNEECSHLGCIQATPNVSGGHANDEPSQKKAKTAKCYMSPLSREVFKDSGDGMPSFFARSEKDSRGQRDSRATDLDKTIKVVPESESGLRPTCIISQDDNTKGIQTLKGTSIKEGSIVEVKKEGNGFKEAWFSANVLCMESGKAFVSYHASRSGSAQLKEWVSLEDDNNHSPRIRLPPLVTGVEHEGTKKRRRGATGDYVCSLGDKVDVRVKECWREGVIMDKNKIDSTTITVHFPDEEETSIVRVWHLRPTFVWKDGVWIESSSSRQRDPSHKGDTPNEKRLKMDGPSVEESKNNNLSKTFQLPGHEIPTELPLLPLSDNEIRFNVGNNIKKDNKLDAPRTLRSGLQKEGTRVVFGVPKPGKKKKFMEVSKHYGPESSNKNDPLKEKYMMPKSDAKEKQQGDLMTRVPKPGKPISSFGRTLSRKDKFPSSAAPTKNEGKKSLSNDGSESEQHKRSDFGPVSSTERAAQGSFVFSSAALSRNMFTSNARSERAKRGNRAPTVRKSTKEVMDKLDAGKQISENSEPRRSNRRIQPTSRLLEGLQSSLVIPKFPSLAYDKGHRIQNRSTPKGK